MKTSDALLIVSVILIGYNAFAQDFSIIGKVMAGIAIAAILVYMYVERRPDNSREPMR